MLEFEITWSGSTQIIRLDDGEHTVGRASESSVQVRAPRVSKQHAVLRIAGEQLWVRDLGSTNGTEVDGRSVGNDEVEVPVDGKVSFGGAILQRAGLRSEPATSLVDDKELSTLLRFNIQQGFSDAARDRIVRFSSDLFELLASDEDAEAIGSAACRFVARCVSAHRVVLLEDRGEATSVETRAHWTLDATDKDAPLRLSSTLVGQVMRRRDSVLVANPLEDPKYTGQESIMALSLRSAMAAPLFDNERVRGILYVDTADPRTQYSKDDLEVLTATANAVAVKLRNMSLESELRTAAKIQRRMLPDVIDPPEGFELDAYQVMCRAVGGDLYHCVPRPNGKTLVALGDVSGKGTPAALAMSAATVLIGMLAEIGGEVDAWSSSSHCFSVRWIPLAA
jgi:adenylate cyclase